MTSDILVLGGGFGGLAAVHRLRELLGDGPSITLLDRGDRFVMGFAKLWDLGGVRPIEDGTRPLANLAAHGVDVVQAEVTAIDPATRTVTTDAGAFTADALVVAMGAVAAPAHGAMLADSAAHDLYDLHQLAAIRRDLDRIERGRVGVVILGGPHKCPPAPYEAALIIDGLLRGRDVRDRVEVVLSTPAPITLPVAGVDASRFVADHLGEHQIGLLAEHRVTGVDGLRVHFDGHDDLDVDVLLAVPASVAPAVLVDAGLTGPSGWIEVDRHTFATSFDGVWAIGDCTHVPTSNGALPMAGVFAAAGGRAAADGIAHRLGVGRPGRFDGHGFCFLELPGEQVAYVEGDFYADPAQVALTEPSRELFLRKQAYESENLDRWLPWPAG